MNIDQLIQSIKQHIAEPDTHSVFIPKEWGQGRTAYGGISAALIYVAIQDKIPDQRVLRSFNCNFIGPVTLDHPFSIKVDVLREGKNVTQIVGSLIQESNTAVMCQASFGVSRESKVQVVCDTKHSMVLPKKPKFIPQIPKVTPKFLKHMDLAIEEGGLPFTGSKISHIKGWMRLSDAPESITDAHIIALIDAWPPTILQMLRWPAPASTMSWNIEFIHPHRKVEPTDWFAYQAHTRQAANGYGHTEANIWDAHGELIAISRQAVTIFD